MNALKKGVRKALARQLSIPDLMVFLVEGVIAPLNLNLRYETSEWLNLRPPGTTTNRFWMAIQ
jgi:hypothetical protein